MSIAEQTKARLLICAAVVAQGQKLGESLSAIPLLLKSHFVCPNHHLSFLLCESLRVGVLGRSSDAGSLSHEQKSATASIHLPTERSAVFMTDRRPVV